MTLEQHDVQNTRPHILQWTFRVNNEKDVVQSGDMQFITWASGTHWSCGQHRMCAAISVGFAKEELLGVVSRQL